MFGKLGFENLRIHCIVGVNAEERIKEQEILVDISIKADFQKVALTDNLTHAICYAKVADSCSEIAKKGQFHMLETLAFELVQQLTDLYRLSWIKVVIKKPSAISSASYAFVEYERGTP